MPRRSARLEDSYQQPTPKKLCNSPINKKVLAASKDKVSAASKDKVSAASKDKTPIASKDKASIASKAATTGKNKIKLIRIIYYCYGIKNSFIKNYYYNSYLQNK
jgi:hypothetical protein